MALVVLTQAELSERVGGDEELGLIASSNATLDAAAVTAISKGITDVSSEIESKLTGLGLDYTTVPNELKDIGADLVVERLYGKIHSVVPKDIRDTANLAREKLKDFIKGLSNANGTGTTAQQEAARFTWSNIADEPADTNPRQTVRARMRKLP